MKISKCRLKGGGAKLPPIEIRGSDEQEDIAILWIIVIIFFIGILGLIGLIKYC